MNDAPNLPAAMLWTMDNLCLYGATIFFSIAAAVLSVPSVSCGATAPRRFDPFSSDLKLEQLDSPHPPPAAAAAAAATPNPVFTFADPTDEFDDADDDDDEDPYLEK